jgi:hypothetical protein
VVIKPAFPGHGLEAEFPAGMDQAAREDLVRRIAAEPDRYVAQEQVDLSTAPVRTNQGLEARHVVLRVFAAWDGASYSMLPGGLTRVATGDRSLVVSMQLGGGSKDTWVLGKRATEPSDTQPAVVQLAGRRSSGELPSRAADNLFWLGRYAERLEHGARLVRALLPGLSGEGDLGSAVSLDTVIHLLGGLGFLSADEQGTSIAQQRWNLQRLMGLLVFDPTRTAGLGWNLKQIRRVRYLARAATTRSRFFAHAASQSRTALRGGHESAGWSGDHTLRFCRTVHGKHHPRQGLAFSGHRPAFGAGFANLRPASRGNRTGALRC